MSIYPPPRWHSHPALLAAGCLAVGILVAASVSSDTVWTWTAIAGVGLCAAVAVQQAGRRRLVSLAPLCTTLVAGLVIAATGAARYAQFWTLPPDHVTRAVSVPDEPAVTLEGRISDAPDRSATRCRFSLATYRVIARKESLSVRGTIHVTLARSAWDSTATLPDVERGDRLRLHGTLRPPPVRRNPADFDYGQYLRRRGIHATVYVYDMEHVTVLGPDRSWWEARVASARSFVRDRLRRLISSPPARAMLEALVLGDRSSLDHDHRAQFARTGLMHLLAVSGLHVLLVGLVLYQLLRPLLVRLGMGWMPMEVTRSAITGAVLLFYLFLSGSSASTVRAVVMAFLMMGGTLFQRSSHSLNTLGVAACMLLVARPTALFDAGFQLSFAAVGAIVSLHPVFRAAVPDAWNRNSFVRGCLASVSVSLVATLGTLPVLLHHFGYVSFAGLVLNLGAIPLTASVLACGFLALLLAAPLPAVAGLFAAASERFAELLLALVHHGDRLLSWTVLRVSTPDPWYLLAFVIVLVGATGWHRPRIRWRTCALALVLVTAGVWTNVLRGVYRPHLEVVFFDVGHGDAALLSFPRGRHVLVDTGSRTRTSSWAARTVLNHLERRGIRALDAVVVTHPDGDHLGGLPTLLRSVPIGRVIHNGYPRASTLYAEVRHLLDSLSVPLRSVRAGDTLLIDPSVDVRVLGPDDVLAADDEPNEASIVLRVQYAGTGLLLTGDVEEEAEERLVSRYDSLLRSDVVKVPHHGARTSSTPPFVDRAASPASLAVISAGGRRFDHPHEEVVQRWREAGAGIAVTRSEGAVIVRSDGSRIRRERWR